MTITETLSQLKSLSNEKMKAHQIRAGADEKRLFGVKTGDIRTLAKKIKTNHELGLKLWQTQNYDARLLAILIMKPALLSVDELNEMAAELDLDWVADWFNSYILKDSPHRDQLREMWLKSENNWQARCGWSLLASKIAKGADGVDLEKVLDMIEREIPNAAPAVQWTMNFALAYTGIHHPAYRSRALEIGEKLGIYRDYPVSKGCTSPFAPVWINEMVSRQGK